MLLVTRMVYVQEQAPNAAEESAQTHFTEYA